MPSWDAKADAAAKVPKFIPFRRGQLEGKQISIHGLL
jgi:hypothetical protein